MMTTAIPPKFDIFDPDLLDDPYPTYARLRNAGPLCRGGPATWGVTRHADVSALLRDCRLGHGMPAGFNPPIALVQRADGAVMQQVLEAIQSNVELPNLLSALDPPQHTRLRGLLSRVINPPVVRRLQTLIGTTAYDLITEILDRREADLVSDLALPLQMRVMCDLLGIPQSDRAQVAAKAAELGRAIILLPFATAERGTGEQEARWLKAYVSNLVRERRIAPGDDLISAAIRCGTGSDHLGEHEIVDNLVFLFFAGFETTMHLTAGGCLELLRHPDQLALLRDDPALTATAVEEILRYDPPLQWVTRVTLQPVTIAGRPIRAGRIILLLLASANRDGRLYDDPDQLDVTRHPNPHLSFGGGVHHCLGVMLARAQAAMVFEQLISRCRSLDLAGSPIRRNHPIVRSYASVPVAIRPA